MGHDRRTDPESQDRRWYEQGDHAEADNQVLPDDPAGAAAQPYGKRKMRKVVGHERNVGGLERNVRPGGAHGDADRRIRDRSEEHTSEIQSLMRRSYAVFCLKKKKDMNR